MAFTRAKTDPILDEIVQRSVASVLRRIDTCCRYYSLAVQRRCATSATLRTHAPHLSRLS